MNCPALGTTLALFTLASSLLPSAASHISGVQQSDEPAAEAPRADVIELMVQPRAAPTPALAYRLLPMEPEKRPGNAAPIYLRIRHELSTESYKAITEETTRWLDPPIDELPIEAARTFVDQWGSRLKQIEYGTLREDCDWSYTLPEQRLDAITILLPDAQEMRNWVRLLSLKARVEIAEGNFDEATRTIRTGLAFARHIADAPFLINDLIGVAAGFNMIERAEELIARPGAPNLYWALTALPTPLISLRESLENEQALVGWMVPELAPEEEPASETQWSANLERLHARLLTLDAGLFVEGPVDEAPDNNVPAELDDFVEQTLSVARAYLANHGHTPDAVERMTSGEAITRYLSSAHYERRDRVYKFAYLSYPEAAARYREIDFATHPADPALRLFDELLPVVPNVHLAQVRLDRKIAALRVVEAVRMHAAENGGKLPATLDEVTIVPIPTDPVTGEPFAYRLDGDAAVLDCPAPEGKSAQLGFLYRITLVE